MSSARRPKGRHRLVKERRHDRRSGHVLAATTVVVGAAVIAYSVFPANGASPNRPHTAAPDQAAAPVVDLSVAAFTRPATTASEIGEDRTTPGGDTTLLQVRKVLAPAGRTAPAGREWYGIRARTCLRSDVARSGSTGWSDWAVVTDEGRRYAGRTAAWKDFPAQQYRSPGLRGGECLTGWVLVAVPRGTFRHVTQVAYRPGDLDALTWQI